MSEFKGKVLQVLGAVVDVEFPDGQVPAIFNALKVTNTSINAALIKHVLRLVQGPPLRIASISVVITSDPL